MGAVRKKSLYEPFLGQIDNELTCIICEDIFTDAVILMCSHSYCKKCIENWSRTSTLCPICCSETNGVKVSNRIVNNIVNLKSHISIKSTGIYSQKELTTLTKVPNQNKDNSEKQNGVPLNKQEKNIPKNSDQLLAARSRNTKNSPCTKLTLLKKEELNGLPKYLITGIHLDEINEVITAFNNALQRKYGKKRKVSLPSNFLGTKYLKIAESNGFLRECELLKELSFNISLDRVLKILLILKRNKICSVKKDNCAFYMPK